MCKQVSILLSLFLLTLIGCSHNSVVKHDDKVQEADLRYSAILYIHGDSDYLYHTSEGEAVEADTEALQMAKELAASAGAGEFFIFHRNPERTFLGLIPRRSSHMYHFKNGELVYHLRYRYTDDYESFLQAESGLYQTKRLADSSQDSPLYFIYFGHEIPLKPVRGYHQSAPHILAGTDIFRTSLKQFLDDDSRFDLVALSTCSNGTPAMAESLSDIADYLLASPKNLHLSYFDISELLYFENNPEADTGTIALRIAEDSFSQLTSRVHTVVSIALYDLAITREYTDSLSAAIDLYLEDYNPNMYRENRDCALLEEIFDESYNQGIELLYRPPRFGANANIPSISGWGCKVD